MTTATPSKPTPDQANTLGAGGGERAALRPGTVVHERYLVAQRLGSGGSGDVHAAIDLDRRAAVAIKVAGALEGVARARIDREARLGRALGDCPGIVGCLDSGELEDGRPFLVHPLIAPARPLDLGAGVPVLERLARLEAAATRVEAIHARGVVHRDLKPANFLLDPQGEVWLVDFGLAKRLGAEEVDDGPLTQAGASIGTPSFMPIEQFEDAREADTRADVYALGVMLYLALTGRMPYEGNALSVLSQLIRDVHSVRGTPRPSAVCDGVPEALDALCARSMQVQPARRLASASEFLAELRAALAPLAGAPPAITPRPPEAEAEDPEEAMDRTVGVDRTASLAQRGREVTRRLAAGPGPGLHMPLVDATERVRAAAAPVDDRTERVGAAADDRTERVGAAADDRTERAGAAVEDPTLRVRSAGHTPPPAVRRPGALAGGPLRLTDRAGREAVWAPLEALGRGGLGEAWLVRREEDGLEAALKVSLEPGDLSLEIERRILEQIDHPNVVGCLGHGPAGTLLIERAFPNPLLVLDAVTPPSAGRRSRYTPLPPGIALELSFDLLRGIEHLHSLSFCHHDIKLGNFLVAPVGPPLASTTPTAILDGVARSRFRGVLIDLGGARSFQWLEDLNSGRDTGELVPPQLTPALAPPEALIGRPTARGTQSLLLPSHDLYAAGITIYMLLTGHVPYHHTGARIHHYPALFALKEDEQRGAVSPICRKAIDELSFEDVRFVSADPGAKARFQDDVWTFLSALTGPASGRPTASAARRTFQDLFQLRGTERDPRPRQGTFSMDFATNRLAAASALAAAMERA